jgi:hypothetical protein
VADPAAGSGARFRAETLYAALDVLRELRPRARTLMVVEARRDPAWEVLQSIPFFGPVRVSLLLATMKTPWRFRTKRNLWAYAGLAVVTESSADHEFVAGRPVRRRRKPLTRRLNKNHNRVLKDVFKSTATSSIGRPGPVPGSLSRHGRTRHARGHGTSHAGAEVRRTYTATLENRRSLRSETTNGASGITRSLEATVWVTFTSPRLQVPGRRCDGQSQLRHSARP